MFLQMIKKKIQETQLFSNARNAKAGGDSLKRGLPEDCDWMVSDTRIEYNKANNKIDSIHVGYTYKNGYFNPWAQRELFDSYLRKSSLYESIRKDARGNYLGMNYYWCWIPSYTRFNDSWKQSIGISVHVRNKTGSTYKDSFVSLAKLVEAYLVSDVERDRSLPDDLTIRYKPTRVIIKSIMVDMDGHGRHELEGDLISVYSEDSKLLYETKTPFYTPDILKFVKILNEDVIIESK